MEKHHALEDIYTAHHSEKRGEGFTLMRKERGFVLTETIGKGKKVLDVGCRDGALTKTYAEGNEVLGLDIDPVALKRAAAYGIETKKVDLNGPWDVPGDHFDAVVAGEVIEHLYYPDVVVSKITAALKKDGVLIGSVPNAFSLINRVRLFFAKKGNTPLQDPTHINHFTRKELEALLEKHFNNVTIIPVGTYAALEKFFPGLFSFMLIFVAKNPKK